MAEWDPMTDLAEGTGGPDLDELWNVEGTSVKVTQRDHERLATDVLRKCDKDAPWEPMPDPCPDLTWHEPTCSFESWKHTAVKVKVSAGIVYVTLNRPKESNTFSQDMVAALCDVIFLLHSRKDLRVAVFTGEGKLFCAGRDPQGDPFGFSVKASAETLAAAKAEARDFGAFPDMDVDPGRLMQTKFWHALITVPQFTICLANGSALGDGMGLLCCCDMAIGLKTSFFGFQETEFGVVNAVVSPYVLAKMGAGATKKMFLLGKVFSAEAARDQKIINMVVDSLADAHKAIEETCAEVTKCGPRSVALAKELVMGVAGTQVSEFLIFYTLHMAAKAKGSEEARLAKHKVKPWEEQPIAAVS